MKTSIFILFLALIVLLDYSAQAIHLRNYLIEEEEKGKTEYYKKGIEALSKKDTISAEKYFKESIRKHGDALSHFELAKIYLRKNTFHSRNLAYENLRIAAWKEPKNLEIRYAFANLMRDFARLSSFDEYKKILAIDSTQVDAWLHLGELKFQDFSDYNNSVRDMGEMYGSLQEYADEDFIESEKYFLSALANDSLNYSAILNLSKLYERAGKPEKGIPLLQKLIINKKDDKAIHECLALLFYKTSKIKEAHSEFKKALELMSQEERKDFTFNSVKLFLENSFQEVFKNYSEEEIEEFINVYWKVTDPLYLTDYNERLIEHYARVAYANLYFTLPEIGITGWKSNMGETVLRYGEPISKMRIRPQFGESKIGMKTEVWNYEDVTLAFTDISSSGNFKYAWPASEKDKFAPQVAGNYLDFAENLKRVRPTYYSPKFEGPKIEVPYSISQLKNLSKRNNTDIYLSYLLSTDDSLIPKTKEIEYTVGFYFFDKNYDKRFSKIERVNINDTLAIENIFVTSIPDSGYTSFEVIRTIDKGTSSSRAPLKIRKFSNNKLDISDIIFCYDVSTVNNNRSYFERKGVFVKPNPLNYFKKSEPVYLYFEIYNLAKNNYNLTDFEQSITISEYNPEEKSGFEKIVSSVINLFGSSGNEKITLTSNYQTLESDPQIYFQLDFSKYEPGDYLVEIKIRDKISGNITEISKALSWGSASKNLD